MMTDLLITGATGFVGAHIALRWRRRHPAARIGCLLRGADAAEAQVRLDAALRRASSDAGDGEADPVRADALLAPLDDPAALRRAETWLRGPTELVHCAAALSFREADRASVWRTNVDGTAALLAALPDLAGVNYVSTAYVAGSREGVIPEAGLERPARFNNPYEESKWTAEALVRDSGARWRIMRPSIVMAHSATHRMSSRSGFYQVVDTLLQLRRQPGLGAAGPIALPIGTGATLDLVPVDAVAADLVDLIGAGSGTAGRTFHLTAAEPLSVADVLRELTPMSGVALELGGADAPLSPAAKLVMRGLRYYRPYLAQSRRFDRSVATAALGRVGPRIGLADLRGFVRSYLAQVEAASLQDAA